MNFSIFALTLVSMMSMYATNMVDAFNVPKVCIDCWSTLVYWPKRYDNGGPIPKARFILYTNLDLLFLQINIMRRHDISTLQDEPSHWQLVYTSDSVSPLSYKHLRESTESFPYGTSWSHGIYQEYGIWYCRW